MLGYRRMWCSSAQVLLTLLFPVSEKREHSSQKDIRATRGGSFNKSERRYADSPIYLLSLLFLFCVLVETASKNQTADGDSERQERYKLPFLFWCFLRFKPKSHLASLSPISYFSFAQKPLTCWRRPWRRRRGGREHDGCIPTRCRTS